MSMLQPEPAFDRVDQNWFATTHWSVVLAAGQISSPETTAALERLCRTYWYPLYAYIRRRGYEAQDAQDLTQEFFARLLEKNYLDGVDRAKGKFRSFLLAALNHFLSNQRDRERAAKRGGKHTFISLDTRAAEALYQLEPLSQATCEKSFDRHWAQKVFDEGMICLQQECAAAGKSAHFDLLKTFLAGEAAVGEYVSLGTQLGLSANGVAVSVHRLRERYRELVRAEIAHTVGSPSEIDEEIRYLFEVLKG